MCLEVGSELASIWKWREGKISFKMDVLVAGTLIMDAWKFIVWLQFTIQMSFLYVQGAKQKRHITFLPYERQTETESIYVKRMLFKCWNYALES